MSSIFLSHNRFDKPFVRKLTSDLQRLGVRVWFDEAEIQIGDSLIEKIQEGIDQMDYVGVVLSSNSINSEWVRKEVEIAMTHEINGRRVKVLPMLLETCELPGFLQGKLYADFRDHASYQNELAKVADRLGVTVSGTWQKDQNTEERLRFWLQLARAELAHRRLANVWGLLAKPIPLIESLRLWRYARRGDERRMLWHNLRGFGMRLILVTVLLSPGLGYLSMELERRARDIGALVVHNPLGATLTLRCIRHYADTKACTPDEQPLKRSSIYIQGPADYVLTAHLASMAGQVRFPVYIKGYGHHVTVTVVHPPDHLPDGMAYIPGGVFRMGDKDAKDGMGGPEEVPAHDVEVDGFAMDQYEVSNAQYAQCVAAGKCAEPHYEDGTCLRFTTKGWERVTVENDFREAAKPVVCVTWEEARAYCEYRHKRLPTEAEWEKAAAGPEGYTWSFGNPPFDGTKANYCDENCDLPWTSSEGSLPSLYGNDGYATTAPVRTYPANGYDLYDMSGNVAEWVADWYDEQFYQKPEALRKNPENREQGSGLRVLRGRSWADVPASLRVSDRGRNDPASRGVGIGFRCVVPHPQ